jgi:hypothetical protein
MTARPGELPVSDQGRRAFADLFGTTWQDALKKGRIFNCTDGARHLGISIDQVAERAAMTAEDLLRFGPDFYVCKLVDDSDGGNPFARDDIFVVNALYPTTRAKYTAKGAKIKCFEVDWEGRALPWHEFRSDLIGASDPQEAPPSSVRGTLASKWNDFGLKALPDEEDNGIHVSASPFEALVEKMNWLNAKVNQDAFGKALLAAGISEEAQKAWMTNPPVCFQDKKRPVFEYFKDLDFTDCVDRATKVSADQCASLTWLGQ